MPMFPHTALLLMLLLASVNCAHGFVWIEAANGELSGDGNAPTVLTAVDGSNLLEGRLGCERATMDSDIITFTLAPGSLLTGTHLLSYCTVGGPTTGSFISVVDAPVINMLRAAQFLHEGRLHRRIHRHTRP